MRDAASLNEILEFTKPEDWASNHLGELAASVHYLTLEVQRLKDKLEALERSREELFEQLADRSTE